MVFVKEIEMDWIKEFDKWMEELVKKNGTTKY